MPSYRRLFQPYELAAFLGECADDFDTTAIVDEATETDPRTGSKVWTVGPEELAEICQRHDLTLSGHQKA